MRKILIGAVLALSMIVGSTAFAQDVNKKCCRKVEQCPNGSLENKGGCCTAVTAEKMECKFMDEKPCCKKCEECTGQCPEGCCKEECRKECCQQNGECKKECRAASEDRKCKCRKKA